MPRGEDTSRHPGRQVQGQLFDYKPTPLYDPPEVLQAGVEHFAAKHGRKASQVGLVDMQIDSQKRFGTARSFAEAPKVNMQDKPSYDAFIRDTNEQYEHLTRPVEQGGLGIKHEVTAGDPYKTPQAMAADINRGQLKTLATSTTGSHPYIPDEVNDRFRAVHDAYGHAALGRGFSRHGEEAAYQHHKQMYSDEAQSALATETIGQSSYLVFGPTGDFGPQKMSTMRPPQQEHGPKTPGPKFNQEQFKL